MIVRTVEDLKTHGSYREKPGVWSSARYLLRRDGMGLTLTETTVAPARRRPCSTRTMSRPT